MGPQTTGQWNYVGEFNTDFDKPERLLALYRTGPHPRSRHDDQILGPFAWHETNWLSRARVGRVDDDFRDLPPDEAHRLIAEMRARWEQNLARAVDTVIRGFTDSGFPDAAERARSVYADLRWGTAQPGALYDLFGTNELPKTQAYPDDSDAYAAFQNAWDLIRRITQPRPGSPIADSNLPGER